MAITLTFTTAEPCPCCKKGGVTLSCRTRGGVATLVGFSEFTTPSTPPKKFLNYVFSGNGNTEGHYSSDCSDAATCFDVGVDSGQRVYNPATGLITDTGSHVVTGSCSPGITPITDITAGGPGDSLIVTRTSKKVTNDLACHSSNGIFGRRTADPTYQGELQNEYTDEMAKDDLVAGDGATWSGWDESGRESCSAEYELRTILFHFRYQEAQWKVNGSGLVSGKTYTVKVHTVRAPFGSPSFTPYSTIVASATADSAGNFEVTGDVPNDEGFTTAVINADASA